MGAKHVINPNQLTLFERAGDLADPEQFYPMDAHGYKENWDFDSSLRADQVRSALKEEKLDESWDDGLYQDIERHGVRQPVSIKHITEATAGDLEEEAGFLPSRGGLYNGHHRVYSQNDIDPKAWVPVRWMQ